MDDLNDASWCRLAVAKQIAPVYAADPKVVAVIVGGSVARGWADRWSDLELALLWFEPSTADELTAAVERVGGQRHELYPPKTDEDSWEEIFTRAGLKIDLSHQTLAAVERIIQDVVVHHDPAWSKQIRLAAIHAGIPLHGVQVISDLRARSVYPDSLARAAVAHHLRFGPHGWLAMLAEREDLAYLYDLCCEAVRQLLGTLHGLNRIYPMASELKWMIQSAEQMPIAPPQLAPRLKRVFRVEPADGVRELGYLIDETIGLVEQYFPELDTAAIRQRVAQQRPTWSCPSEF